MHQAAPRAAARNRVAAMNIEDPKVHYAPGCLGLFSPTAPSAEGAMFAEADACANRIEL
jgi:hypothetical protein